VIGVVYYIKKIIYFFVILLICLNFWAIFELKPFSANDPLISQSDTTEVAPPAIVEEDCGNLYLLVGNSLSLNEGCTVSDETIAICQNDNIIAVSPGQARISLINDNICKFWTLTVTDYQSIIAPMGRKQQLETIGSCNQWSCSNPEYVQIDDTGTLTPVSVGECVVSATDSDGRQYGWNVSVKKTAYLTIDDWPDENTIVMLDIMKKYDIKATFFLASQKNHLDIYQRIVDEGHAIGNHTKTHNLDVIYKSSYNLCRNVELMDEFLNKQFGVSTKLFRFPGGYFASSPAQREGYKQLSEQGYRIFDWTCVVEDIRYTKGEYLLREFRKTLDEDVEIILMHNKKSTAGVFEEVIQYLLENNYVCLPLDEQCATYDFIHGWQE